MDFLPSPPMFGLRSSPRFFPVVSLALILAALPAGLVRAGTNALSRVDGDVDATVLVDGLSGPEGLAIHPRTREIFVVEKAAGQISRIRDGKAETVVHRGFSVVDDLPPWAVNTRFPLSHWMNPALRNPEGITFFPDGRLVVTEDVPGGRLMEFREEPDGSYTTARAIPIPWMEAAYSWDSVCVATGGRLFIAGSTTEMGPGMYYGAVLMRDPNGDWWMVDYGPFAKFSSVGLSPDGQVLLTSEQVSGQVNWWDVTRHREMGGTMEQMPNLQGVAALPDGSILAVQESGLLMSDKLKGHDPRALPGRIVRIDPLQETVTPVVEGLQGAKSILVTDEGRRILVAENTTGAILDIRPRAPLHGSDPLLDLAVDLNYLAQGRAPKKWPSFLRGFISEAGVDPVDETLGDLERETPPVRSASRAGALPFTLEEFSDRIPVVAGRIRVEEMTGGTTEDPLKEIRFVYFYPNQVVRSDEKTTPGLCLFSALYASGRQEKSRVMDGLMEGFVRLGQRGGEKRDKPARLFVPMASCRVEPFRGGTRLTLAFLGIGMFDDFYLTLSDGRTTAGTLVRDRKGGGAEHYRVSFMETGVDGTRESNLLIAGVGRSGGDEIGWYKLGRSPTPKLLGMSSPTDTPFVTRRTRELLRLAEQNEMNFRLAGKTPDEVPAGELPLPGAPPQRSRNMQMAFRPVTVGAGEYHAPMASQDTLPPVLEGPSPSKPLRADTPGEERRAEEPGKERRATTPDPEREAGTPPPERRANTPARDGTAGVDDGKSVEDRLISKAIEAWQRTN